MNDLSPRIETLADHPERIDDLVQLLHEEWKDFLPWARLSGIAERLQASCAGQPFPHTLMALDADANLLGTASVKLYELADHLDKRHWLGEVLIRADARGKGIGSALIRRCLEYCAAHDSPALYLYTPDQQALYRRLGWHDLQQATINGEAVTIMRHDF